MFFNVAVFLLLFLHTRRCIPFWIDCVVYVWDGRNEICTSSDNTLFLNSHRADGAAAARCANFAYVYFVFYMHCAEQTIYIALMIFNRPRQMTVKTTTTTTTSKIHCVHISHLLGLDEKHAQIVPLYPFAIRWWIFVSLNIYLFITSGAKKFSFTFAPQSARAHTQHTLSNT